MTDSMDEWDGGAIDGRDQYLGDAPHWSNGDGETIDATDSDEGEVTTENVPGPEALWEADDTDGSETEGGEVPTWPPNPETLTEIRQRLLNGSTTRDVGEWVGISSASIHKAATDKGRRYADIAADIPPLTTEGNSSGAKWVIDERDESQSELTDDDFEANESRGSWPPLASCIDNIRRRLVDGSSLREVAKNYDDANKSMVGEIAKGETYQGHPVQDATETPPVQHAERDGWVWVREVVGLETDTADNDDPGPESEGVDTVETDGTEAEGAEVPTWPPNPETLTEIRQRLLNGSSTKSLADWAPTNNGSIYDAATGESFAAVGADADIPALKTVGNGPGAEWVIDEGGETQSESTDDDWPPTPDELDDIRRRLVAGESPTEIAEEYPVCRTTMDDLAKAETHPESEAIQNASTPPVESPGSVGRNDWVWAEPVDLETETTDNDGTEQETGTTDNDDAEPETETTETEEELGPEPDQQDSGLVSGDERPVARDPPEPETPTVPTRWLVAGVAFIAGWILSRLVRGGED